VRIGFDAKRAAFNRTGLGNYSRYVVDILSDKSQTDEIRLYTPKIKQNGLLDALLKRAGVTLHAPDKVLGRILSSLWRSFCIVNQLKRDKVSLFHGLSNELPYRIHKSGIKSVVTIHDLIFLTRPECYKPIDRFIYNIKFRYACRVADKVVAVSECTKRDIVRFYGIPESKISVVYQGCDPVFSHSSSVSERDRVRQKYSLPDEFILYVGSIESRKNLLLAVKALLKTKSAYTLVAVGRRTSYTAEVEAFVRENGLENRVKLIHQVPFSDLPVVYQLAKLFVYPSFYEGFGIPIIEAIHSGLPVIAATGSCLEEAGGPNSIYVNPLDDNQLSAAFDTVMNDEDLRKQMIESGRNYVRRFDAHTQAEQIRSLYTTCLL